MRKRTERHSAHDLCEQHHKFTNFMNSMQRRTYNGMFIITPSYLIILTFMRVLCNFLYKDSKIIENEFQNERCFCKENTHDFYIKLPSTTAVHTHEVLVTL